MTARTARKDATTTATPAQAEEQVATPKAPTADTAVPTPAKAAPNPLCGCGCGAATSGPKTDYRPGHDARHAGAVGRALVAGAPSAKAEYDRLSPKLQAKASRFVDTARKAAERKAVAAQIRAEAKAELAARLAAI